MTPLALRAGETVAMLRKAITTASDLAHNLNEHSPTQAHEAVAEALSHAHQLARDLAQPNGRTGCPRHPDGALDTNPPAGWGECLLCNTHRRRAHRPDHSGQADAAREAGHLPAPRPYATTTPEYAKAAERLSFLPDLGAASLEAARAELGDGAGYEDLIVHAAANPVTPALEPDRNTTERPGTEAVACGVCGTALDPDNTCWSCTNGGTDA